MEAISSSASKTNTLNPNTRSEEELILPCSSSKESGWTSYFEEYLASKEDKGGVAMASSVTLSSSLISDASSTRVISMKKNKRKTRGALFNYDDGDDPLEDTACSPLTVNLKDMERGSAKQRNIRDQDANGFGSGLDLRVNSINRIECTELYYQRRPLTMISSFVKGC